MENFNKTFGIAVDSEHLDVLLNFDIEAFVDPALVSNNRFNLFSNRIHKRTSNFFKILYQKGIYAKNPNFGIGLLEHLHEPSEYHLGYSRDSIQGKAIGYEKALTLYDNFKKHKFAQGNLSILFDPFPILLLIEGIGQDNISDIITNICRDLFCDFTKQQCLKHNVPLQNFEIEFFNDVLGSWEKKEVQLPIWNGKKIILIPQWMTNKKRNFNVSFNRHICKKYVWEEILKTKNLSSIPSKYLKIRKNGKIEPNLKALYEDYSLDKSEFYKFIVRYQNSISTFLEDVRLSFPAITYSDLENLYRKAG